MDTVRRSTLLGPHQGRHVSSQVPHRPQGHYNKPDNLVVNSKRNFSLKIIDFDVAMRVEDEDEVVEGQCGTKGWMTPEMVDKSIYSPIKADRWSTGAVILYLLDTLREEDAVLRMTGRKLTAHDPEQRPSMP